VQQQRLIHAVQQHAAAQPAAAAASGERCRPAATVGQGGFEAQHRRRRLEGLQGEGGVGEGSRVPVNSVETKILFFIFALIEKLYEMSNIYFRESFDFFVDIFVKQ
jgi:hypothetical protein